MYPHRIRLVGPWEFDTLSVDGWGRDGSTPAAGRVSVPVRWADMGLADFSGAVRFRRKFGRPRRLDDWERVWLTCDGVTGRSSWRLNGADLQPPAPADGRVEVDVTPLLQDRNELAVTVEGRGPDSGLSGEVALEVRCRAFLRHVRAAAEPLAGGGAVRVEGDVVSECPADPLEVYLLVGRQCRDYLKVGDRPVTPFALTWAGDGPTDGGTVRVELVCGAVVWHVVELAVGLRG
jgi:hypothetical protein